jgi:hypothetical protein
VLEMERVTAEQLAVETAARAMWPPQVTRSERGGVGGQGGEVGEVGKDWLGDGGDVGDSDVGDGDFGDSGVESCGGNGYVYS